MAKILVVDDELSIVETIAELLVWDGHIVVTAGDGRAALERLEQEGPFDLVLADFMMPVMDGVQMLKKLRAEPRTADTTVVMMTAAPTSLPSGDPLYDHLLVKPFSAAALRAVLRATTEKKDTPHR
jgi:CheY-like chemotaxis protein